MTIEVTLEQFTDELAWNFGTLDLLLDVVDPEGKYPLVAALETEPLAVVMQRIMMFSGGYANLFVRGADHVRQVSFMPSSEAIFAGHAEDMTSEPPAGIVTIGAFLDYAETQEHGVVLPAMLSMSTGARASNVREVEL